MPAVVLAALLSFTEGSKFIYDLLHLGSMDMLRPHERFGPVTPPGFGDAGREPARAAVAFLGDLQPPRAAGA